MAKKVCMKKELPEFTSVVLQGLAYWMGYKKQLFHRHPIRECEIVGEALHLLSAKIDSSLRVDAEVMFKDMCEGWERNKQGRADIVISTKQKEDFDYKKDVRYVIEVKRRGAQKKEIQKDLKRLAKFMSLTDNKDIRCFLLYVSEGKRPDTFVDEEGHARGGKNIKIEGVEAYVARSRQVKKSYNTFYVYVEDENNVRRRTEKIADRANYACLIEVVKRCSNKK